MKHRFSQIDGRTRFLRSACSAKSAVAIVVFALFILAPLSKASGDDEREAEIRKLQGRYERRFTNDAGTEFRTIKDVAGDQETVTTYDDVGNVIEAHTSSIKVEKRGEVRVLSFYNVTVTAGPAKGRQLAETRSYIYRASDDHFAEVWGLLESDPSPPRMLIWKRVK